MSVSIHTTPGNYIIKLGPHSDDMVRLHIRRIGEIGIVLELDEDQLAEFYKMLTVYIYVGKTYPCRLSRHGQTESPDAPTSVQLDDQAKGAVGGRLEALIRSSKETIDKILLDNGGSY